MNAKNKKKRIKKYYARNSAQNNANSNAPKKVAEPQVRKYNFDWIRIVAGILVLTALLGASLWSINHTFAEKQAELVEEEKDDFGGVLMVFAYTVPLILACAVPALACIGSKKDAQRKHLIKGLIVAGAIALVILQACPVQIWTLAKQRELCEMLEQKAKDEEDYVYPEYLPSVKDVTLEMQRTVEWTAKGGIGLAVIGVYHAVRYKKLKDGEQDDEIPADELDDDPPDVDWQER